MLKKYPFFLVCVALFWMWGSSVIAAPSFPALTGRVVDNAHILSPEAISNLETLLKNYETGTTNQVVVVTLPSLNGYSIEDYGYQLGRHWQLGQKDKNNGVLLIVAPNERKVRIEVGYGLEPILTDALSSEIIISVILPQFKSGNYQKGIIDGTQSILDVLGGKAIQKMPAKKKQSNWFEWFFLIIVLLFFIRNPSLAFLIFAGSGQRYGGGSGDGGGSSGGGFSGGGGSFGGGGSSGSW